MICDDVLHLVEAIAAGDLEVEDRIREHFETCPRCASELATARRIERALQARPAPEPPVRFTPAVLARLRNESWQAEQHVDRIFNVAIVAAVLLVVGGIIGLTNVDGVLSGAATLWGLMARASGQAAQGASPTLLTYVAAVGLLMSTLVMWWWAERSSLL